MTKCAKALLMFLMCVAPAGAAEEPSPRTLMDDARAALERGDTKRAIALATQAIVAAPDDVDLRFFRAQRYDAVRDHKKAQADFDVVVKRRPEFARAYHLRGGSRFKSGDIEGSIKDMDTAARLDPRLKVRLWERGISYYYAGEFKKGAEQFEAYQTYHAADVENIVWRYACQARFEGAQEARADMMPLEGPDRRVPMMQIDALFRGEGTAEEVFAAANASDPTKDALRMRLFYAHLYVALYYEAHDKPELAAKHMLEADRREISHYMWDVAHVHAMRIQEERKQQKREKNRGARGC